MVTRLYFCKNCSHEFETVQPMSEKLKKRCPKCKKNKLIQDLSGGYYGSVKTYNTLVSLAEKNTKELGIYGRQAKEQSIHDKEESIRKQREDKLIAAGMKPTSGKKNPIPKDVMKRVISGDKNSIQKYIIEGK